MISLLQTTLFFSLISCVNHGTFFLTVICFVISGALLSNAFLSWALNALTILSTSLSVMFNRSQSVINLLMFIDPAFCM